MPKKHPAKKSTSSRKSIPTWAWAALAAGVVVVIVIVAIFLITRKPAAQGKQAESTGAVLQAEISVSQAYEKYQAGAFLLDVRTPAEWDSVRIPNTTLIPLDELSARINEVPKDQEIVVVCRSGNRSRTGRDILKQAGYNQVTSMSGGVNAWKAAGYPTEP